MEIDPRVIAAARTHFELPPDDETLTVIEADGALYMRQHPVSTDIILLDGFDVGQSGRSAGHPDVLCRVSPGTQAGRGAGGQSMGAGSRIYRYFARLTRAFDGETGWISVQHKTNIIVFAFGESGAVDRLERMQPQLAEMSKYHGLDLRGFARDIQWSDTIAPWLENLIKTRSNRRVLAWRVCIFWWV